MNMVPKRNKFTAKFKLQVVEFAENSNNCAAARKFGVSEKNVRDWRKVETQIKAMPKNKCAKRGKCGLWPQVDSEVLKFVTENRQNGLGVSRGSMRMFAMKVAERLKIPDFKASHGWCTRFMKREDLVLRKKTKISQKLPEELDDKLASFQKFIINMRKRNEYRLACIGNMDETPMNFDMPLSQTVDKIGEKTIFIRTTGHEKTRFSVVLSCMADGTKLPPMVIFKRKTMPNENFPKGVIVHVHVKGWMDEAGVLLWLKKVWGSRPGWVRNEKSLLVWDTFRSHLVEKVTNEIKRANTDVALIPGGLTSILQPLDVSINKPFKDAMRKKWNQWLMDGEKTYTKGGNIRAPTLATLCQWIVDAWTSIRKEIVVKSFKKCCISNNLDGTEDDILWEEENNSDDEVDSETDDIDPYDDNV